MGRTILFAQGVPCIRNYKEAAALTKRGHEVHLAYRSLAVLDMYGVPYRETYAGFYWISAPAASVMMPLPQAAGASQ